MNAAKKIKEELTQRAYDAESNKYLVDYVMNCFRKGENPVEISANITTKNTKTHLNVYNKSWHQAVGYNGKANCIDIDVKYENGRHYAKIAYNANAQWYDVSDHEMAQCGCVNGQDLSDKILFLEMEGFRCVKSFEYGKGDLLKVYY